MKLAISTLTCPDWTLPQIAEAAAAAGVTGVDFRGLGPEIDVTRLREFSLDLPRTLDLFRQHALCIPCYNTSVTLISPSPQRWQEMLDEAHRHAQLAGRTATPFIRVFGGALLKGMTRDQALAMASRHLRQIVKICRPHAVRPLLETHDDWSTSAAVRELLHEFDPADAGALWDVEHTHRAGEAPADTLAALAKHLCHVHVKDSARPAAAAAAQCETRPIPKLLGEGDVPVAEALRALHAHGYAGWVCLETEKRWHPDLAPAPEVSIPQFARFVRAAIAASTAPGSPPTARTGPTSAAAATPWP